MKNIRASLRAATVLTAALPVLALVAVQGFVIGPVFKNYTTIPNMFYNGLRKLFGIKIEFNAASAPVVKDKPTWFTPNHISVADFIVMGCAVNGTFAGKGEVLQWPLAAQVARVGKYIGLRRSEKYNPQSRAKIIKNFNDGFNTIMFPEATATVGDKVYLFRAGLLTILFGDKGVDKKNAEVALQKPVVVQPVAIKVKEVEGQSVAQNPELHHLYGMYHENDTLKRIWKRMQIKTLTVELTVFPALDPKDFKDAKELINKAALDIASVVNPGQTTFEKAVIPGQPVKKAA